MQISKDSVAQFHLRLTDANGLERDNSRARGVPVAYLHGHQNLLPMVEAALDGHQAGDHVKVVVPPEQAYGLNDPLNIKRVKRKDFDPQHRIVEGEVLRVRHDGGTTVVTVRKIGMHVIDLDMNHPLAGQTLTFELEVVDVRAATADEIAHGHAHGDGGVGH